MKKPRHLIIVPALLVLVILAAVTAPLLAQSGNSWYVVYYSDPNWSVPTAGQYTSYIAFDWGTGAPSPGMPSTNWTANMTTTAYFSAGNYTFSALADDEISMQIDGVTYINTMGAGMAGKPGVADSPDDRGLPQHRSVVSPVHGQGLCLPDVGLRQRRAGANRDAGLRSLVVVLLPGAGDHPHHTLR